MRDLDQWSGTRRRVTARTQSGQPPRPWKDRGDGQTVSKALGGIPVSAARPADEYAGCEMDHIATVEFRIARWSRWLLRQAAVVQSAQRRAAHSAVAYGSHVARARTHTFEVTPAGKGLTDAAFGQFEAAIKSNRRLTATVRSADWDLGTLELRASIEASGPTNALAIGEVAFLRAAEKAGLTVQISEACIWIEEERVA